MPLQKIKVDEFKTETIDGAPVSLLVVVGNDTARLVIPGWLQYRHVIEIDKNQGFDFMDKVALMNIYEVWNDLRLFPPPIKVVEPLTTFNP